MRDLLSKSHGIFKVSWHGYYQPLLVRDDGIVAYRKKTFYLINKEKKMKICSVKQRDLLDFFHIFNRLLRRDVRCGCYTDDDYYFFWMKSLYRLKINEKRIDKLYNVPRGESTPLNVVEGRGEYTVLWGEYGRNEDKHEVCIYGLHRTGTINVVKKLKGKNVRHVHNIIFDGSDGYYVFCGDNEKDAGIYYFHNEWKEEEVVLVGTQNARAVVGFITKKGILFATDSVSEQNYIFLMQKCGNKWNKREICKINGSVIYGTRCKNGFIISTTVESPESSKGKIQCLLSRKRGKGILSDEVDMIYINEDMEPRIVYTASKDRLPYKLFQYGCFKFPEGLEKAEEIVFFPLAVKGVSGQMGKLHL